MSPAMWMVAVNVAVFVALRLVAIVMRFASEGAEIDAVVNQLSLSPNPEAAISRPWTLLTYMFVQYDPLHLLINMLWLWMFADVMQRVCSPLRLWLVYLAGGIAGAVGYIITAISVGATGEGMVGASASVLAIMGAAMVVRPNVRFHLFIFGDASLKIVGLIAILLVALATEPTGYATHAAHAGGLLAGFAAGLLFKKKSPAIGPISFGPSLPTRDVKPRVATPDVKPDLDQLLDKIRSSGYGSLTAEEREELFRISSHLQKREK